MLLLLLTSITINILGLSLGKINVARFADGEVNVVVNDNVRGNCILT